MVGQAGHTIHQTYAALTPLIASPAPFATLAGIALDVTVSARSDARSASATGGFLFTHGGYSGPAVLDVSHVAVRSQAGESPPARVVVKWTRLDRDAWTRAFEPRGSRTVLAAVSGELPSRLAEALIAAAGVDPRTPLARLTRAHRISVIDTLVHGVLPWSGDEGYKKAEVTGGGVSLEEIDHRTMESRVHQGLYICGEILDAFGPIGGYNFFWAWATGRAAGLGAARRVGPVK